MSWGALVLRVPPALEDALAGALGPAALGLEASFDSPGRLRLRVFFEDVASAARALGEAAVLLQALGEDPAACRLAVESVPDGRWAEAWQEGLRPFPLGARFAVHPAGVREPVHPDRIPILLVPGRAFGTGEHPTTRLAAEALERHVRPGSRWLDLGTGTGVLALIALRLGAGTVTARDNDPEAVEVARETLAGNGADGRVRLELGSTAGLPPRGFDGVAANIVAPFFMEHAEDLAALLDARGILLATGLLAEEAREVAFRLERAGLRLEERTEALPWVLLGLRRA